MYLVVYSKRWGHDEKYRLRRTETGWFIAHIAINGDFDKQGNLYLFENLDQDFIKYPLDLGPDMQSLWNDAQEQNMIQKRLDEIGANIRQLT